MKKIIYIALILTLVGFIPVLHQELTGCSAFGYNHLVSQSVITTADSCATSILAVPLIPSVQLSLLLHFNSVYINYFFLGVISLLLYTLIGYLFIKIKKYNNT